MGFLKIATNIPADVEFQFDQPKEYTGQYGTSYNYGVVHKGENMTLSATKILHEKLQAIGNLRGKSLQILKYEDGQKKLWKILDQQGNELNAQSTYSAPQAPTRPLAPQSSTNVPNGQFLTLAQFNEQLDKMRKAFKEMDTLLHEVGGRNQFLEEKVETLAKQVAYMTEMFKQGNPDAYKLHADQLPKLEIPIVGAEGWEDAASKELFGK